MCRYKFHLLGYADVSVPEKDHTRQNTCRERTANSKWGVCRHFRVFELYLFFCFN